MTTDTVPAEVEFLPATSLELPSPRLAARDFPSARDVLRAHCELLASELLVQHRRHSEQAGQGIHEMRVACARLRSLLVCFKHQFEGETRRRLDGELSWLLSQLGEARDLEVVSSFLSTVPSVDHHGPHPFARQVSQLDRFASWDLCATLASARYLELLDLLARPGTSLVWQARSANAWRVDLQPDLLRAYARVRVADSRAAGADPAVMDEALHAVRKRVRILRYATEAVESLDRPRYSPIVGRLISTQNVLGGHHDAVVVGRFLDRMSRTPQDSTYRAWLRDARGLVEDQKRAAITAYRHHRRELDALPF